MAFRKRHDSLGGHGDGHGELLITPLLDLFVALIPFLILSAVMVNINIVDVAVSKPVAVLKKSNKPFSLHVKVGLKSASIFLNNQSYASFDVSSDGAWLDLLHKKLVEIKKNNMDQMEIKIEPTSDKVSLDLLMAVMDASRSLKESDGELTRKDPEVGQKVKLKYLFPKVILRGVYG